MHGDELGVRVQRRVVVSGYGGQTGSHTKGVDWCLGQRNGVALRIETRKGLLDS